MNLFERAIQLINPAAAYKRERFRLATDILQKRRYDAAGTGRRFDGWHRTGTSADAEINRSLSNLRNGSRDLVRNNPWAKRAISVIANHVVGTGIRLTPVGDEKTIEAVKREWKAFAETKAIDHDGRLNFYGLQKLIARAVPESGEVFIVRRRNSNHIPFAIEILEGDYCDHNYNVASIDKGAGYVKEGIQFNAKGQRTGYWLYTEHPGEAYSLGSSITPKFVPAGDVIHVYRKLRPGQNRGVPEGVSGFLRLRDFDDFEDAELISKKINACFSAFVHDARNEVLPGDRQANGELHERLEPGLIQHLPPGKEISFANPPTSEGSAEYKHNILMGVAAAYGQSYELLSGDMSRVNFASGKMGRMEFNLEVEDWQEIVMIPGACQPVFDWFIDALKLRGLIDDNAKVTGSWTAPAHVTIDLGKDIKAYREAIRCGLMSWRDVVKAMGYDPDELAKELQSDTAMFDALGLMLDIDLRTEKESDKPKAK
jgi:lambda family phage portal protein